MNCLLSETASAAAASDAAAALAVWSESALCGGVSQSQPCYVETRHRSEVDRIVLERDTPVGSKEII